ncbi:MAG: HAMP domain-containing protein, partial [Myxococcota bacterium]|nr:HAMP domain-containing protein [Myxococcota bacterium]
MRWGIRSQVLLTLSAVLAFGLLASYVVTSRVTRATVLDAQVAQSRRLVELVGVHLQVCETEEAINDALVQLRRRVTPDHLFLLGQDLRPMSDTPEMRLAFSNHLKPEDLVPFHAREVRHGILAGASSVPVLVVLAPLESPVLEASMICLMVPLEGTMTKLEHITALYLLFALVILVMAVLLGYVFLGRTVVQPLHRLVRVVERIRGGQFRGETEEGPGSTMEMRQIFGSVERMTEQLEADRKS